MKPLLANMLGQLGQALELVAFKGKSHDGKRLLHPRESGRFLVVLGERVMHWRLPLGSLLPPTYDPRTDEIFPGNYTYNPFTGEKLQVKED